MVVEEAHELSWHLDTAEPVGSGEHEGFVVPWFQHRPEEDRLLRLRSATPLRIGLVFEWRGAPWRLARPVAGAWVAVPVRQ